MLPVRQGFDISCAVRSAAVVSVPAGRPAVSPRAAGALDHESQDGDVDGRVVAALERVSQALGVLLRRTAREHDLSAIQVRLLVSLRRSAGARQRVRELARMWGVETVAVLDAIAGLKSRGLVEHSSGESDVRTVRLLLTPAGRALARTVSTWAQPVSRAIASTPAGAKEALLPRLVEWVAALHRARVLAVARVCPTCRFFASYVHPDGGAPHHCQLFETALADSELRVDCSEHRPL